MCCSEAFTLLLASFAVCNHVHGRETEAVDMIVDPERIKEVPALSTISGRNGDWDDWESWEPSLFVDQDFPVYRSGYDLDGLMVYVVEFGKYNFRALAAMPEGKVAEVWKACEQWIRFMEKDAALNNGQGIVSILDFDGFSLAHYASQEALQFSLKVFSYLARQHNAIKYGFLLNANFAAETWINLARPLIGTFLNVFEVCGTRREKWKPLLLRKIPASQLPPKYGGNKDWKCLVVPRNRCSM